jgi:TonB-dependent starch-binding outer membrane protein SusC
MKKLKPGKNYSFKFFPKKIFSYLKLALIMPFFISASIYASGYSQSNPNEAGSGINLQQQSVTGTVSDSATGESLPGVNVYIEGTQTGTVTGSNGGFTLQKPAPNAVVVFSYVGYVTSKVPYTGQSVINIKLKPEFEILQEVVVVGYGTLQKKDLTSAISNVTSNDFIQGSTNSVAGLIQGKVAGLSVNTTQADPSKAATLQIRGIGSLNASNEPLIVIDGVPGTSLNSVAQQDIESFSVLKDGAGSSIYGTRGANGVIIITTKKAGKTDKVNVAYDGYVSSQRIVQSKLPEVLNHDEFIKYRVEGGTQQDMGGNTVWFEEISRPSFDQNHNLSFDYGTEKNSYRVSLSYRKTLAITDENDRKEYGGRINFNNKILKDRIELSGSLAIRNSFDNLLPSMNVWNQAVVNNPTMPVYDEEGGYTLPLTAFQDNPVGLLHNNFNYRETKINNLDITMKWNILKSLNTSIMYAEQVLDNDLYQYSNSKTNSNVSQGIKGIATRVYNKSTLQTFEWNTNYELKGVSHNLKLLGGYSYQEVTNISFYAQNSDFPSDVLKYDKLSLGSYLSDGRASMETDHTEAKLVAFYGRAIYSFKDVLLATATVRHEGSTKYGKNNKWGTFKSLSGAWRITQMGFMSNLVSDQTVNDLKLRVGYGETGRDINDPYMSLATYSGLINSYGSMQQYYINGKWVAIQGPDINANPDLRWERAIHYGVGLDFTLFNSQLSGSVDLYMRDSKDLLYTYPAIKPPMIQDDIIVNVGTIRSKGFEWDISWRNKSIRKLNYSVSLLGSYTKTLCVSLSNDLYSSTFTDLYQLPYTGTPGTAIRLEEGGEVGAFYGYRYAGVGDNGHFLVYNKEGAAIDSDIKTENDKAYIGNGTPKWQFSMSHTLAYKNFDLSIQFLGAFNYDILNAKEMYWGLSSTAEPNTMKIAYTKNKDITGDKVYSDYFLEKGDYLKLDYVTLGYRIPGLNKKIINSLRIFASVQNVFTITGYSGTDPSLIATNGLTPSIEDINVFPAIRTYTLGLKLNL